MHWGKAIRLVAVEALRAAVVAAVALAVFLKFYYRPVVTLDIRGLVAHEQAAVMKLSKEEAEKHVAEYIRSLGESVRSRKEIVLVRDAVLNPETLRDITDEYKQ
jgi:hypothetical protein